MSSPPGNPGLDGDNEPDGSADGYAVQPALHILVAVATGGGEIFLKQLVEQEACAEQYTERYIDSADGDGGKPDRGVNPS